MPDYEFLQVNINADIDGELFTTSGRQILNEGWKSLDNGSQEKEKNEDNSEENSSAPLHETSENENGVCSYINLLEKKTKAPARFTEATLLKAMNEVYLYVKDSEIKKILKETDGIGTAATQAGIIQEIIDDGVLIKKGKNLISSLSERDLIHALPEEITLPDMTAKLETYIRKVKTSEMLMDEVINNYVVNEIRRIIASAQPITIHSLDGGKNPNSALKSSVKCPLCGSPMFLRHGKNGAFWGCSKYPDCKMTASDNKGKPVFKK